MSGVAISAACTNTGIRPGTTLRDLPAVRLL